MRTSLAVAACLAAMLITVPASALAKTSCKSTAHAHFVGLGGVDSLNNAHTRNCVLAAQARAGAGVLRQSLDWKTIERRKGHFNFHAYDSWVLAVAKHHMRVLPILFGPPKFRAHDRHGDVGRPTSDAAFGRYAAAAVRRYGPKGTLWRGKHRKYRAYAMRSWQIWNEPNLPQYWGGHPNAKQYAKLLKAASHAIHKVDKHANIVTAGLPESLIKHAIQASKYIPQLYKAHGARYFSTLAINPYAPNAKGVVAEVKRIRKTMNHHHDHGAHLWVTEVGWGTGGPANRFNIGAKGQARQIKALLKGLHKRRKSLKLTGVIYFGWKDLKPYPPAFKDQWGLHTGLLTLKNKAKPGFAAFASVARHLK